MTTREVTVPAVRVAGWLAGFTERHGATVATATDTEVHLVGDDGAQAWLAVPFPPLAAAAGDGDPRDALIAHVLIDRTVGVLLVRRGGYAVGVFAGRELISSKVGSSYVQGTTSAGGWSQQRFARRRANQARAAFADAADVAVRILVPHRLDALVCGGDRAAVAEVLADVRLREVAALRVEPLLPVPDPRLRVLQVTPDQFRAVRIKLDP